ncbi:MAG: NAD(P)-binding protein [Gemmatimonadetes bacterium]|nr:NAD(P)-binding protein [Gemmatimonadota bacterium]
MFPNNHIINTITIGGGQAGITLSYYLQQRGVKHLVLERDRVAGLIAEMQRSYIKKNWFTVRLWKDAEDTLAYQSL